MAMTLRADKGAILSWNEMDANFRACLGVHNLLHVQDQKAIGVLGGGFTSGAWRTRDLNTILVNSISASLVNNQITLPTGSYFCVASAPANIVYINVLRLYSVTSSSELLLGQMSRAGAVDQSTSHMSGSFSIKVDSVIELQHICANSNSDGGFGVVFGSGFGTAPIFSDLKIWKLA